MSFSRRIAVTNEAVRASSKSAKFRESDERTFCVETSDAQKLSTSGRMKVSQSKTAQKKVFGIGNVSFPAAKQTFKRLHRKFGLPYD